MKYRIKCPQCDGVGHYYDQVVTMQSYDNPIHCWPCGGMGESYFDDPDKLLEYWSTYEPVTVLARDDLKRYIDTYKEETPCDKLPTN